MTKLQPTTDQQSDTSIQLLNQHLLEYNNCALKVFAANQIMDAYILAAPCKSKLPKASPAVSS